MRSAGTLRREADESNMLTTEPHPLSDLRAFLTVFREALDDLTASAAPLILPSLEIRAPVQSSDEVRAADKMRSEEKRVVLHGNRGIERPS